MAPRENEDVQSSGYSSDANPLLDTLRVDLPARKPPQARPLPPTPEVDDAEWNSGQNVMCSSMLQFGSQSPDFESSEAGTLDEDGGFDIPERRRSIQRSPAPRRTPKPRKEIEENQEHNELRSPVLQSGSQSTRFETSKASTLDRKGGGCDSPEKRDSIQHLPAPRRPPKPRNGLKEDTKHNELRFIESQEIEEDYEIDLKRLEITDTLLGEGEFGIVYKGRYRCKDEKVIDVAVKQLKGLSMWIVNSFLELINFIIPQLSCFQTHHFYLSVQKQ